MLCRSILCCLAWECGHLSGEWRGLFSFIFWEKYVKNKKKRQGEEKRADGTVWDIIYDKERLEEGWKTLRSTVGECLECSMYIVLSG